MSNRSTAKRRGHDEGTFRHRADGRWEVSFYAPNGKRASVYGRTRPEARAKFNDAMAKDLKGLSPKADKQPLADFLRVWLEEVARPKLKYSTLKSYESYLDNHIVPEFGHVKLGDRTPQISQKFLNSRTRAGSAPRTVQYLRAILRTALNQAVTWGYIERNSASAATPPKMARRDATIRNAEEARILIESTASDRLGNLFAIALFTGLRQGELLGLHWSDIDFKHGTFYVHKALQNQDGAWKFIEIKNDRTRRTLHLPEAAVSTLVHQQERIADPRRAAGSAWQEGNLVFPSPIGCPLVDRRVTEHLTRKVAEAGLPQVRFHDLRHTCATLLLEHGVHERIIMAQLGHSQISLTMNTSSHVRPAMLSAAASALDRALGPTGPSA